MPPAWRNRTSRHSRPVQQKACLFIRGWDAALSLLRFTQWAAGEVLFCQWPPLHFDFSAAFEGSGYILPPQLALSTLQRVNFIAGHDAKGRCHEGGAGQWGTREGT